MTKFKLNFKFIVEACENPQKNRRVRLSNEIIGNYESIMY
jgi:hypothetical protein